jgi:acylphosphatase
MAQTDAFVDWVRAYVLISGRVQGVGYRFATAGKAKSLGLRGWVRNLPDGRVEATFEGPKWQVERMINWCYEGPPNALVQNVESYYERAKGLRVFEVRY